MMARKEEGRSKGRIEGGEIKERKTGRKKHGEKEDTVKKEMKEGRT